MPLITRNVPDDVHLEQEEATNVTTFMSYNITGADTIKCELVKDLTEKYDLN